VINASDERRRNAYTIGARGERCGNQDDEGDSGGTHVNSLIPSVRHDESLCAPPNGSRLSCGALKKDSFHNLRAPTASSAC